MEGKRELNQFLSYLRAVKNASEHTVRNYGLDIEQFLTFAKAPLHACSKTTVRAFLAHLSAKGLAKKTLLRRLSSLRSFFKFLLKEGALQSNPIAELEGPKAEKRIPPLLTYAHVERLLAQPDATTLLGLRDRCIMELFYSSGLRLSELVSLSRSDVDLARRQMKVRGKGKKERIVPITKTAIQWMRTYLDHPMRHLAGEHHSPEVDHDALFLNRHGRRLTARSVDRTFKLYLLQSGLAVTVTPHIIRHTIATHWLEKGMDLKTIQKLLGHSSLATTTLYTQVSMRLKRQVYDTCHPGLEIKKRGESE